MQKTGCNSRVLRIPVGGTATVAAVDIRLESFAASAALETSEGLRVNAVGSHFVNEAMEATGTDSSTGIWHLASALQIPPKHITMHRIAPTAVNRLM